MPIPISARYGDNVTSRSERIGWFSGPTLVEHLETVVVDDTVAESPFRFPVQYVNRPNLDFRGYAGTIASGSVAPGDEVVVAKSGKAARVKRIVAHGGDLAAARRGPGDHAGARRRGRGLARQHAGVADGAPGGRRPVHRQHRLVRRKRAEARALLPAADRNRPGGRDRHRPEIPRQRQQFRAGGGEVAGDERGRRLQSCDAGSDRLRRVCARTA